MLGSSGCAPHYLQQVVYTIAEMENALINKMVIKRLDLAQLDRLLNWKMKDRNNITKYDSASREKQRTYYIYFQ